MTWNWLEWLRRSPKDRERRETLSLLAGSRRLAAQWSLANEEAVSAFAIHLVFEACERRGVTPAMALGGALYNATIALLHEDAITGDLPSEDELPGFSVEEGVRLRSALRRHQRFLSAHKRLLPIWRDHLVGVFSTLLEYFPDSAFVDIAENGTADDDSLVLPSAPAYALCEKLPEVIERLMVAFFRPEIVEARLFETLRERFDGNVLSASGYDPASGSTTPPRPIIPTESKQSEPAALVQAYLADTPFENLFNRQLPFAIPFPVRFEHTHIVGGSGHGKTQLMQFLIHHDLVRSQSDGRSVVVIDSQGDLIRTIAQLGYFSPSESPEFADRFVLVDPNDIEHPPCLNMFDFNRDRLSGYAPLDREKILNATIELYEYFFGALLGAELTQRQGLIFRYLARLLIEIPDATIHTLRELMEDGDRFRPYMEKLTGTARSFFATQFFDRKFGETKKQILTRLWGVLSNSALERMFSHSQNKIDLFSLLNEGKIILIHTAKDLLGQEGAAIFGRFFIALISQSAVQRAAMPPHERRPAFVYIDEAQDYFDDNVAPILNQARKYRVGFILAHQNLDQLSAGLRSTVLASTSIKFAGGVSAKDAATLDAEFRCRSEFLLGQRKGKQTTEFACYVKNYTSRALSILIPLGFVESLPRLLAADYHYLIEQNRWLYSAPPLLPLDVPLPTASAPPQKAVGRRESPGAPKEAEVEQPAPSDSEVRIVGPDPVEPTKPKRPSLAIPPPHQTGGGGKQHKYLQHLVKELAEARGFRATIEEPILDGAGRVDVSLERGGLRIACQISVSTTKDWELGGVEKCLAAGYAQVLLIGRTEKYVRGLAKFIGESLEEKSRQRVHYLTADLVDTHLDSLGAPSPTEGVVRGYKVRTVRTLVDPEDSKSRRAAITEVITRSLQNQARE